MKKSTLRFLSLILVLLIVLSSNITIIHATTPEERSNNNKQTEGLVTISKASKITEDLLKDRVEYATDKVYDKLAEVFAKKYVEKNNVTNVFNNTIKEITNYLGIDAGEYYFKDKDFVDLISSPDEWTDGHEKYFHKQLQLFGLVLDRWADEISSVYSLENINKPTMIQNKNNINFSATNTDQSNGVKDSTKNSATIVGSIGKMNTDKSEDYPTFTKNERTLIRPKKPGEIVINESLKPLKNSDNDYEVIVDLLAKDKQKHKDIVLVIDCSLSMFENSKYIYAKNAAIDLVNKIFNSENKEDYRIALVTYGTNAKVDCDLKEYDKKDDLITSLNNLWPMWATNIQAGIHEAKSLLKDSKSTNSTIILLSDGEPTRCYALKDRDILENLNPPFYLGNYLKLKDKGVTLEQCQANLRIEKNEDYPYGKTYTAINVPEEAIDYTRVDISYHDRNNELVKVNNIEPNMRTSDDLWDYIKYDKNEMTLLEADLCKKQNIEIFSIAYDLKPEYEQLMRSIATSEDHFFTTREYDNQNKISPSNYNAEAHSINQSAYNTNSLKQLRKFSNNSEKQTAIDKIYSAISEKILVKDTEPAFENSKIVTDINPGFQFVLGSFETKDGTAMYKDGRVVWNVVELKKQIEDDPSIKIASLKYRIRPLDNLENDQNVFKNSAIIIDGKQSNLTNYKVDNVEKSKKEYEKEYINIIFNHGDNGRFPSEFANNLKVPRNEQVDVSQYAPKVIANSNYIFTGWDKSLIGSFDEDQIFYAQYRYIGENEEPNKNNTDFSNVYYPIQFVSKADTVLNKVENRSHYIEFFINKNEFQIHKGSDFEVKSMDVCPIIVNSKTLLPLRYLAESIDAEVYWNDDTRTATFIKDGKVVKINIDSSTITVNDSEKIELKNKPKLQNGRILLSLTNISKIFDMTNGDLDDGISQDIEWNSATKSVIIYKK